MFYRGHIYKDKKSARPSVRRLEYSTDQQQLLQTVSLEIRRILNLLVEPSAENNEAAFLLDNVANSYDQLLKNTIIGEGPRITVPTNMSAEKAIKHWNKRINLNGDTVVDFMGDFLTDNSVYNRSYWRIATNLRGIDNEVIDNVDLQRMDPKSINEEWDNRNGWRKFIQKVENAPTYKTPGQFIKGVAGSYIDYGNYEIVIPDDQHLILHGSLYTRPPMDVVLPFIILKYWILTFMKKYADKSWSGILLGFVGDPKTSYYPRDPMLMQDSIDKTSVALNALRNFGVATFPGDTRVEQLNPPEQGKVLAEWFDKMNREIMFGLSSSIAARESSGVYKGNQIADESSVRFMKGIRTKLENLLKRFYVMNIVPDVDEGDIIFTWSELRTSSVENIADAFEKSVRYGVFKGANERRKAMAQIFSFLMDDTIDEATAARLDKEFMELNKPSVAGEGNVANNGSAKKNGGSKSNSNSSGKKVSAK